MIMKGKYHNNGDIVRLLLPPAALVLRTPNKPDHAARRSMSADGIATKGREAQAHTIGPAVTDGDPSVLIAGRNFFSFYPLSKRSSAGLQASITSSVSTEVRASLRH
jgi:hypothetical protein